MSGTNQLRPTQNPATRYGQPGISALTGPQLPLNALRVPPQAAPPASAPVAAQPQPGPAVAPPVAAPPVLPPAPVPQAQEPGPVDTEGRISGRVPVPPTDFHPDQHKDLHEAMGAAFDQPEAAKFVMDAYDAARAAHPHIAPHAALMTARDAWHAIQHGFIDHDAAHAALRAYPDLFARAIPGDTP